MTFQQLELAHRELPAVLADRRRDLHHAQVAQQRPRAEFRQLLRRAQPRAPREAQPQHKTVHRVRVQLIVRRRRRDQVPQRRPVVVHEPDRAPRDVAAPRQSRLQLRVLEQVPHQPVRRCIQNLALRFDVNLRVLKDLDKVRFEIAPVRLLLRRADVHVLDAVVHQPPPARLRERRAPLRIQHHRVRRPHLKVQIESRYRIDAQRRDRNRNVVVVGLDGPDKLLRNTRGHLSPYPSMASPHQIVPDFTRSVPRLCIVRWQA